MIFRQNSLDQRPLVGQRTGFAINPRVTESIDDRFENGAGPQLKFFLIPVDERDDLFKFGLIAGQLPAGGGVIERQPGDETGVT